MTARLTLTARLEPAKHPPLGRRVRGMDVVAPVAPGVLLPLPLARRRRGSDGDPRAATSTEHAIRNQIIMDVGVSLRSLDA